MHSVEFLRVFARASVSSCDLCVVYVFCLTSIAVMMCDY